MVCLALYRWTLRTSSLFLLSYSTIAQAQGDPLFASNEILDATIIAPLTSLMRNKEIGEYVPGTFRYLDHAGDQVELEIGVRTRGHFRLENCSFAPLRINFRKSQTANTLLANQDKLKLVTHCQKGSPRSQQSVLREFLAYRTFNILTEVSFRVRLLRITYVDTDKKNLETVSYGFLIEHKDRLAERIGVPAAEVRKITVSELLPKHTNLTSLFHYFIGNTDFSHNHPEPRDNCCHNHELFANEAEPYYSVPYDFDLSGFVDMRHFVGASSSSLRKVQRRLYQGWCVNNAHIPATVALFVDKRDEISALIATHELISSNTRTTLLRFIEKSYESIDTTKEVERKLVKNCQTEKGRHT